VELGLDGKSFVVGGASSGLGRAVAEQLVAEDARVLLVARNADALQEVARDLGERAQPCPADLSEPSGVDEVAEAATRSGGIDGVLVNSGGPPFGPALELTDEQWLGAFNLLIGGPVRLLRALVSHMNEGASVLFITSTSVREPIKDLDSSNVLRPGVAALVKCLAWRRSLGRASASTAWHQDASIPCARARSTRRGPLTRACRSRSSARA
jgi:3-oxoacyl-[acyl-carrier protein] reductase